MYPEYINRNALQNFYYTYAVYKKSRHKSIEISQKDIMRLLDVERFADQFVLWLVVFSTFSWT